ncbi:MAG: hypothetical protein OHK0023_18600 [Anaerolineae bacterium]
MGFHLNWIGALEAISKRMAGGEFWREHDAVLVRTGIPLAVFNGVLMNNGATLNLARLNELIEPFRHSSMPYAVQIISERRTPTLEGILTRARFAEMLCDPLMMCEGDLALPDLNPEVRVDFVQRDEDRAWYTRSVMEGFDMAGTVAGEFLETILAMPEAHHVIAWYRDELAGAGSLLLTGGVAGIYNVTTLPFARRRGVAVAIMDALHRRALDAGYTATTLASSQMGIPLYKRLGYRSDGYQIAYVPVY